MSNICSDSSYEKNIEDLHVNLMMPSCEKDERFVYPDRNAAELASRAAMSNDVHSSAPLCITPSCHRGGSKRLKEDHDEDNCSDSGVNVSSTFYNRFLRREGKYKKKLLQKDHEIAHLKAIIRQYRAKAKKARTLAMASIAREDYLLEGASAEVERGNYTNTEVESDVEDGFDNNLVQYSYIDSELFDNED